MIERIHQPAETPDACASIRPRFSEYMDGAVTGRSMLEIDRHLKICHACDEEFRSLRSIQQALSNLRTAKPPADLGVRLRVAVSQEKARREARWGDRFAIRWENSVRPMLVQVSVGLAATVLLVGTMIGLLGVVAPPQDVLADDTPLGTMTVPHYLYSAVSPRPIQVDHDTTIVVEAAVDAHGQVYDYRIVSEPQSAGVEEQVAEQLMLSVFEPARVFGTPVRGRVILTFAGISVRG